MSTIRTSTPHDDVRWDRSHHAIPTWARTHNVVGVEHRYELVDLLHLAFPGLPFAAMDVRQLTDGSWTFPIPPSVATSILSGDAFDIEEQDDDGETFKSMVINHDDVVSDVEARDAR